MKSLPTTRHQRIISRLLLVALWSSFALGVRVPSSHAQQTSQQAYELLSQSEVQNKTDHEQALQTALQALADLYRSERSSRNHSGQDAGREVSLWLWVTLPMPKHFTKRFVSIGRHSKIQQKRPQHYWI